MIDRVDVRQPASSSLDSGQAGAYFLLLNNFVPTVEKSLNLLALKLTQEVNGTVSSTPAAIQPVFGFTTTASNGGTINDLSQVLNLTGAGATGQSVAAILGQLSFQDLMQMANPASSNYSIEVDDVVSNLRLSKDLDASRFRSVASFEAGQFVQLDATAARHIESLRSSFSAPASFITSSIATTVSAWKGEHKTNETMSQVLSDQKNAISGVNLDEEAANLVKYQQLYNASSKLIQTHRQMFDTLLAMLAGN